MSLIEEALNKAEREKTGEATPLPSTISQESPPVPRRNRRPVSQKTILVLALVCIIGAGAWLAYWWNQRASSLARRPIELSREAQNPLAPQAKHPPVHEPTSAKRRLSQESQPPNHPQQQNRPNAKASSQISLPKHPDSVKSYPPVLTHKKGVSVQKKKTATPVASPKISPSRKVGKTSKSKRVVHRHASAKTKRGHLRHKAKVHLTRKRKKKVKTRKKVEPLSIQLAKKAIHEGLQAYNEGDLRGAANAFERSLIYAEPSAETLGFLGKIYMLMGKRDKALSFFSRSLEKNPKNPEILDQIGLLFMEKGKNAEAIRCFLKALQSSPYRYATHVNLGIVYRRMGNLSAARDEFLTAIHIRKDKPEAFYNLAGVYEAMELYPQAVKSLESFLKISEGKKDTRRDDAENHLRALRSYINKERNK